jgi:uncharacterized heparinase superfamily protein
MLKKLFARRPPDIGGWLLRRGRKTVLYSTIGDEAIERLRRLHPEHVKATIAAAERILTHEFDLLGSGPFVPVDPDRRTRDGYTPIDWYLDPVGKLRFPRGIPSAEWDLLKMRPGTADVKFPWELARCQHWPVLGQAFRLTGDDRFAREIANELDDFVAANPVGVGINWTCAMDEAIRAVNWAMALEMVRDSVALGDGFHERAYRALFDHGVYIRSHLENTYEVTSNHFLSDVVGLWFLGTVFSDLDAGREWLAFARATLETEMDVQVLPDGADFESSIPYHRLVTELFLAALRLGDFRGESLSRHYRDRVRDMVAYLAAVLRPDGLMPQVGDADDGRLHVLSGYGTALPQDPRHIFGPAAAMFGEPAWAALAECTWETIWWGLEPRTPGASVPSSRLFADAGVAVMRAGGHYALITNGIVGTRGFGNHKHCDQLSFEYHSNGTPLVVDPGSYVYTSDAAARNRFRATAVHNTLMIDGVEQNEFTPEWLFRMFESAHPEHVSFDVRGDAVEYVGRHRGYERLPQPVSHERRFRLNASTGALEIHDRVAGRGAHELCWHFHLAPGVEAHVAGDTAIVLRTSACERTLRIPAGLHAVIEPSEYSPSYGVAVPCRAIRLETAVSLTGSQDFAFDLF